MKSLDLPAPHAEEFTVPHRILEDLSSVLHNQQGGEFLQMPLSILQRLGGDLLYASPNDHHARALQSNWGFWQDAAGISVQISGGLHISAAVAAACLGRKDLFPLQKYGISWDWLDAVQWLVFYGLQEHKLWYILGGRFLEDLLSTPRNGDPSVLEMLVLRERPDVFRDASSKSSGLQMERVREWISRNGIHEYLMAWALSQGAIDDILEKGWLKERINQVKTRQDAQVAFQEFSVDAPVAPRISPTEKGTRSVQSTKTRRVGASFYQGEQGLLSASVDLKLNKAGWHIVFFDWRLPLYLDQPALMISMKIPGGERQSPELIFGRSRCVVFKGPIFAPLRVDLVPFHRSAEMLASGYLAEEGSFSDYSVGDLSCTVISPKGI